MVFLSSIKIQICTTLWGNRCIKLLTNNFHQKLFYWNDFVGFLVSKTKGNEGRKTLLGFTINDKGNEGKKNWSIQVTRRNFNLIFIQWIMVKIWKVLLKAWNCTKKIF